MLFYPFVQFLCYSLTGTQALQEDRQVLFSMDIEMYRAAAVESGTVSLEEEITERFERCFTGKDFCTFCSLEIQGPLLIIVSRGPFFVSSGEGINVLLNSQQFLYKRIFLAKAITGRIIFESMPLNAKTIIITKP